MSSHQDQAVPPAPAKRPRGRLRKDGLPAGSVPKPAPISVAGPSSSSRDASPPPKRKRGRPLKARPAAPDEIEETTASNTPPPSRQNHGSLKARDPVSFTGLRAVERTPYSLPQPLPNRETSRALSMTPTESLSRLAKSQPSGDWHGDPANGVQFMKAMAREIDGDIVDGEEVRRDFGLEKREYWFDWNLKMYPWLEEDGTKEWREQVQIRRGDNIKTKRCKAFDCHVEDCTVVHSKEEKSLDEVLWQEELLHRHARQHHAHVDMVFKPKETLLEANVQRMLESKGAVEVGAEEEPDPGKSIFNFE
ncbi:hypothetical protein BDW02DRAFT_609541 [Decorospora gaudefroyi]|uniref:Uncharacterized protein n=1 Tax=Decorospora gaudefroyi TaxID=184978 RepID=A0A6A5K9S3_9PLEO|nr:hypothetical protein BDW02DRAFT_609541 [Decorospora gaudefroyi]